ncbi:Oar protein [beta proteobacterium AAP121]|nr:Oar protein [beta proteobacterium AAP65]KPF99412.1 Oar protein [beta proteobacterium AAP121]
MNNRDWMGFSRTAMAVAVAVVAAAPAFAQNTTASLGGLIVGGDGKPVAGATVVIVHVESGSTNTVTTDTSGRYSARGLRAGGPYTITISKGGQTEKRDNVFLNLAETGSLNATLGGTQTIVVTGRGVNERFNSSAMGSGTNLGSRELAALASIQRNLQDYARTDPRLAQTDKERGEISAAGQNTRFNSITIDGVTTNDTFGLEANNLPTIKQPISIDAIQSVQVNLSNYDVTQKGYTGANINAVTKSGTNEFKGSVYYVWRDDNLVGKRYNRTTDTYFDAPAFEESTIGFTLGGPIIKDKLFFFASYEELKSSRSRPTNGPIGSASTNVGISQSAIDQAISIARNTWNFDAGTSTVPEGLEVSVKDTLLKLDWNINDNHRANIRYTKTEQLEPLLVGFSATGLSLSSWWYNQSKTIESVVGQWFADWTPDLSTELKVSQRNYDSAPTPVNGVRLPAIGLRFNGPAGAGESFNTGNRFLNMGTERSRHFNVLGTETTDIYAGATWNLGKHELKFGLDYANNDVYNAFLQDVNGNYTFACQANEDYSFGRVTACGTNTLAGTYIPTGGGAAQSMTAAQRELTVLENFQRGRPISYQVQLPLAGRTLNDGVAQWSYANTGLFLQDTFKLTDKLNIMVGVRVDQSSVPESPLFNDTVAQALVAGSVTGANTVTRNTGGFGERNDRTLDGTNLVQPRFGFNWNLGTAENRLQLRGGFGLFQGAAANVWLSNPFSNTGRAVGTYSCTSFGNCQTAGALFNPNPANQPALTGQPPAPNVDLVSSDLEQPAVWKANLAVDAELPPLPVVGRLTVGAEWLHIENKAGIYYQHLNLGGQTATGTDGRKLFYTPQTYSSACWSGSNFSTSGACAGSRNRALSNASFNNVIIARKTSLGYSDAITLQIGQPANSGFGWNLAYTMTTAKEVSPLTSSTSGSNWNGKNSFDPNEEVLQNSNYLVKDRVSASLTWAKAFVGNYRTSVGVFYEGRRGKPYSWTYINDLNGDGISGNDLMYIPSAPGSGEVVFRGGATEEARFWEIVNGNSALAAAKGGVVGRNNSFAPWVNNFDVRFSQEMPGFMKGHKTTFTLDFLNFGNLLNKKWGRIDEIGFPSNRSFVNFNGLDNGRYVYSLGTLESLNTRQQAGESQWAVQATLRYEF